MKDIYVEMHLTVQAIGLYVVEQDEQDMVYVILILNYFFMFIFFYQFCQCSSCVGTTQCFVLTQRGT